MKKEATPPGSVGIKCQNLKLKTKNYNLKSKTKNFLLLTFDFLTMF